MSDDQKNSPAFDENKEDSVSGAESKQVGLSKRNRREVTSFLGHEMLFDYISGSLDEERKSAIDEFLDRSKEAQADLIKIMNGIKYAEQLAETVVSQDLLEKVQEPDTYLSVLLKKSKFDQWPVSIKWSIEALIVVVGIVSLLVMVPWDKALRLDFGPNIQENVLAEVRKTTKVSAESAKEPDASGIPVFIDEPTVVPVANKKESQKSPTPPPVVEQTAKPPAVTSKPAPAVPAAGVGYIYRGVFKITNAAAISPKVTDKIQELGGRKAGAVDLGWQKTENAYYYHFTIPEAKLAELEAYLAEYSSTKISRESHPRVMPDGIVRLIIQVEEKKP
jgi:hypothetical protein